MAKQNYFESKSERTAKRRRATLEKNGIVNNASAIYDLQLEHFYEKYGKNKNKWSGGARKLYNDINKGFINSGQSTLSEIKKKHEETYGETNDDFETMAEDNDNLDLLTDDILREQLGSQTLNEAFHDAEINGYSTEEVREAMTTVLVENRKTGKGFEGQTTSDIAKLILDVVSANRGELSLEDWIKESGKVWGVEK